MAQCTEKSLKLPYEEMLHSFLKLPGAMISVSGVLKSSGEPIVPISVSVIDSCLFAGAVSNQRPRLKIFRLALSDSGQGLWHYE